MKRGRSEQYVLENEQVLALLREAQSPEDRIMLKLMVELGMRAGEVAHLEAGWVKNGEIRVPFSRSCDCPNCKKGEWKAKSQASVRSIPIPGDMIEELGKFLRESPKGFGLTRQAIWWKVKQIAKRAKIRVKGLSGDTIYPHVLRATAATKLATMGMSAPALCYIMAWKSIEIGVHYISVASAKSEAQKQFREIMG